MNHALLLDESPLSIEAVKNYVFNRKPYPAIEITEKCRARIKQSHSHLQTLLEKRVPVYGVTTGFGDSSFRFINKEQSETLQRNLVAYLQCGTGSTVPELATRAAFLIRLNSLSRGYSGVSIELIERMKLFLERNWLPLTPCEGSLGASGDLVPLAYLAAIIQGEGMLHSPAGPISAKAVFEKEKIPAYVLKPKEGLALVNGTSTMAGMGLVNLNHAHFLLEMATLSSSWACLALRGRTESFDTLINEKAKLHTGQTRVAEKIRNLLASESYQTPPQTEGSPVQDRYSLRCSPQILGPVQDTIDLGWNWLEAEINSASDNPLISEDGKLSTGGNFYGGYLSHCQDYLKICMANVADLLDRQLMLVVDEKSNRGLTPNLADWPSIPEESRFLHHGLKGLHQSVSAITSEIMAKAMPNSIFSRSSECHNQDKVSLGMSASVQCAAMIEQLFTIQAMVLICYAQALDLRGVKLQGVVSKQYYDLIRSVVPRVQKDSALGGVIQVLSTKLKDLSIARGEGALK